MESNFHKFDIEISGNLSATYSLLFSDIFSLFPNTFQPVISFFKKDYCIILYTDSGYDKTESDKKLRHNSLDDYADDMIRLLEENSLTKIIYVAHSVNALLAFSAAVKAPHLFHKIVLVCATPYLLHDADMHYTGSFEPTSLKELFIQLIQFTNDHQEHSGKKAVQLTNILAAAFSGMSKADAQSVFDIIFYKDCRSMLERCHVPTLILQVSLDNASPHEVNYFMQRHLPNSCLLRIKAKGQLPQLEAPEEITQAIRFFIP